MYIVYSGSFQNEAYAMAHAYDLFKSGYDAIGVKHGDNIRIQVGQFTNIMYALDFKEELEDDGFSCFIEEVANGS